jgi:hypothetical protein
MSKFFAIESVRSPWGDYGDILSNGLVEASECVGPPVIRILRTGPYVPPMTLPFGFIIVTEEFRRDLERSQLTGFDFEPTQYGKVVRLDWHTWSTDTNEPKSYPETGEPEDYILGSPPRSDSSGADSPVVGARRPAYVRIAGRGRTFIPRRSTSRHGHCSRAYAPLGKRADEGLAREIVGGEMHCVSFDNAAMNHVRFGTEWDSGRNRGGMFAVVNSPADAFQN